MLPAGPPPATPVLSTTEPDVPVLVAPVVRVTPPLFPEVVEGPEATVTVPEFPVAVPPLRRSTPPDDPVPPAVPELSARPPVLPLAVPVWTKTAPLLPDVSDAPEAT